ncbi:MAG: Trp biosynthesis-associated membrane protein [Microbacteriaceae bacterium]|nr:Trp biosynthesis-associated membrane protein [Microbacteriaceae bacterium]
MSGSPADESGAPADKSGAPAGVKRAAAKRIRASGRRLKSSFMLLGLAASALTLISWTQNWFTVTVTPGVVNQSSVAIGGDVAAGGLSALGLAGLALVGALSIAGPFFRIILGYLELLIGAAVALSAGIALSAPERASATSVTKVTGVSGADSVAALVKSVDASAWPAVAFLLGILTVFVGVGIVFSGRRWPGSSKKYQTNRTDDADQGPNAQAAAIPDAISTWDALSDGSDPTAR